MPTGFTDRKEGPGPGTAALSAVVRLGGMRMQWTEYQGSEDELKDSCCGDKKNEVMVGLVGEHMKGTDGSFLRWGRPQPRGCVRMSASRHFWGAYLISCCNITADVCLRTLTLHSKNTYQLVFRVRILTDLKENIPKRLIRWHWTEIQITVDLKGVKKGFVIQLVDF